MSAVIAEKTMFVNPQDETRGGSTSELWDVFVVLDDGVTEDPTGNINPSQVFIPGYATNLPIRGSAHSIPSLGLCVGGRVVEVKAKWRVLVMVFYRSYGLFVGGPQTITDTQVGFDDSFYFPIIRQSNVTPGPFAYDEYRLLEPRPVMERVATLVMGGGQAQADLVSEAIAANIGRYYTIAGRLYRFSGGRALYDGTSRIRVEYRFRTSAEIAAVPPLTAGLANVVSIPALQQLWTYSVNMRVTPPTITAVPPSVISLFGATLPGPYP